MNLDNPWTEPFKFRGDPARPAVRIAHKMSAIDTVLVPAIADTAARTSTSVNSIWRSARRAKPNSSWRP
jgi:hypothetical protein